MGPRRSPITGAGLTTGGDSEARPGPSPLRLFDYWLTVYRRTWRGTVISSFITPLLYVLGMGVLLGGFIAGDPARLEGATSYLAFVAPGMVAAQAMTTTFGEMTWPVMDMIKWHRIYFGMIATPLRVSDVVVAHLTFAVFRVGLVSAVFMAVLVPFGVFSSVGGIIAAFFVQLLLGLAFAAVLLVISASARTEDVFTLLFRLGMLPLFLFSGAFFPIGNLGGFLEGFARITPLWQGVDLTRMLAVGDVDASRAGWHLAYLGVLALAGTLLGIRALERRLVT